MSKLFDELMKTPLMYPELLQAPLWYGELPSPGTLIGTFPSSSHPDDLIPPVNATVVKTESEPRRALVETDSEFRAPSHTTEVFNPSTFPHLVDWIVAEAKAAGYEALAGSGHSGLLPMAAAAYQMNVPMIAVRKYDERPKGDGNKVNGVVPHRPIRYAIVDDFIASGETVERILHEVQLAFPQATCAGLILYRVRADSPETKYSFVSDCRDNVARRIGRERAGALHIHARHNLKD